MIHLALTILAALFILALGAALLTVLFWGFAAMIGVPVTLSLELWEKIKSRAKRPSSSAPASEP